MKILVSCLNMNAYGGSELYHYELLMGLSEYNDLDITFATWTKPDLEFHLFKDLINKGIKITQIKDLYPALHKFELIISSQPDVNIFLCVLYNDTPKISIIHSALRAEDAIQHESIKHYIAVQPDIYRCLKNNYGIKTKDISLIYNPIDDNRFKPVHSIRDNYHGVLIGEIYDPLRDEMIHHCVQNIPYNITIVSKSKWIFPGKNVIIQDPMYNTEELLKHADFTVGIGGRTTIEGWMCGIPSYIYKVDSKGRILDIQLKYPPKIDRFRRGVVAHKHTELYNKITNL